MKWQVVFLLLMGMTWRVSDSTCVFESDFGFTLNCAFKKSSIFRVRNLGGVKGYVGLGFSVGDELGFQQSLSTLESNRRRSADVQGAGSANAVQQPVASKRGDTGVAAARSHKGQQNGRQVIPPFKPLPPPMEMAGNALRAVPGPAVMNQGGFIAVPAFAALPQSIVRIPNVNSNKQQAFQPRPQAPANFQNALQMANRRFQVVGNPAAGNAISPNTLSTRTSQDPSKASSTFVSGIDIYAPSPLLMGHSVYSLSQASNISVATLAAAIKLRQDQLKTSTQLPATTTTSTSTTTTTSPTPTKPPTVRPKYALTGKHKVMNAPKEYYPVSYDKNYDDNFTSKVELPETSFSCGDQKHFPGLYADEDLGCMVFHVCAFTDDGLVVKSFLCPESTLFDQTILKCNWWFYVDCKSSKKLYDSNIPISKSYQLMKALAFFSAYRNQSSNAT